MIIKPSSELRNNFKSISELVSDGETVFLTRNGSGDMVVMSQEQYNRISDMLELYNHLSFGEKDIRNGNMISSDKVFAEADKLLNR